MLRKLIRAFIVWRHKTADKRYWMKDRAGKHILKRVEILWPDELFDPEWAAMGKTSPNYGKIGKRPWYLPFNAFLHCWNPGQRMEVFHDHQRWTISICLRGKMIECTPWEKKTLTPGSIVIRRRRHIHAFQIPDGYAGRTWTLFIVGRRNHRQNLYMIRPVQK